MESKITSSVLLTIKPPKIRLVNPGIMGEESVLKSLLGDKIKFHQETVVGYTTRRQPKPPEYVWNDLKKEWDEKGDPIH